MEQGEFTIDQADEEFSDTVFTIETLIQFEAEFVGIDRAIEALQKGTYGQCEVCLTQIPPSRLRGDPVLVRCDAHIVRETPALFASDGDVDVDVDGTVAADFAVDADLAAAADLTGSFGETVTSESFTGTGFDS